MTAIILRIFGSYVVEVARADLCAFGDGVCGASNCACAGFAKAGARVVAARLPIKPSRNVRLSMGRITAGPQENPLVNVKTWLTR
jgi:hypothetical protein